MFNFNQALNLYLSDLRTNDMSDKTLSTYQNILGYYAAHCAAESLDMTIPAAVASYKARMSDKGNKLVTISMHLNILRLFFDFCIRCQILQATNPVLPELMPPRKKIRAERKPYDHLMGESELKAIFDGKHPAGVHKANFLRNRAILFTLLGCGLRNTELRNLRLADLNFSDDTASASVTVRSGKGGKFRIVPFPAVVQKAVREYLESAEYPSRLNAADILYGIGNTKDEWHAMSDENLSVLCKRYVKAATGFDNVRSHACRHAFASFLLSNGTPMAEIQSVLGHSSITTTERYASLLRPTAPLSSGNQVFNAAFSKL